MPSTAEVILGRDTLLTRLKSDLPELDADMHTDESFCWLNKT